MDLAEYREGTGRQAGYSTGRAGLQGAAGDGAVRCCSYGHRPAALVFVRSGEWKGGRGESGGFGEPRGKGGGKAGVIGGKGMARGVADGEAGQGSRRGGAQ